MKMTATEINNQLISMLLRIMYEQELHLTDLDKIEFPLVERTIHTILDIWDTNQIRIKNLEVSPLGDKGIWIQVNESSPVTFIKPRKEVALVS
ncbi:hypothetical protein PBT90_00085 [Algoriphagus halophytocola]|uniref:hypothetical protein n=1 Tax=Algoriphagus halophytocola TaxID=2991499 RepID=UPI0022DD5084|nr:hypothetical protein [Algoriphagus sp. TR-M9]WBL42357.1 hypothetical protein PBT90_16600 [Algoriphagus sp. TR-M9]WBL43106.1 hypothetical protein PBT90_00085 [Algoriphagus sp. TR-M9]